jgi:hypothetical protein
VISLSKAARTIPLDSNWETIRDLRVREMELQTEIQVRRLEEDRRLLETRKGEVERELDRVGEPEASVRVHRTLGRWWGGMFLLAVAVAILSAWWSVNWYLSLSWEKALIAVTLFVLPLIGWMVFLTFAGEQVERFDLRRVFVGLGLGIILCSGLAAVLLGSGRMAGTALEEEQRHSLTTASEDLAEQPGPAISAGRASRVKSLLAIASMIAVSLLTIAGEIAAGIAFHMYVKRMTVVWTVAPYYREHGELQEALAENGSRREEWRRQPAILHARLTVEGLREKAEEARLAEEAERLRIAAEEKENSLGTLVRRVLLVVAIGLVVLLGVAAFVFGSEPPALTVAVIDLSVSTVPSEFEANVKAVDGIIRRMPVGGARLVVLGITEASFKTGPLLSIISPKDAGRFGEYQTAWQEASIQKWRKVASALTPSAKGSDVFGALARAVVEFETASQGPRSLIVLSDMRHVGRGFDLERRIPDPLEMVRRVERKSLVPRLAGVSVWVLGAHTADVEEREWRRLKTFWIEYFRRAGADLRTFSANRQMALEK